MADRSVLYSILMPDPSLPSHPSHELAKTLLKRGQGGMVSFGLKDDQSGSIGARM